METITNTQKTEIILGPDEVALLRESITPALGNLAQKQFMEDAARQYEARESNNSEPLPPVQVTVDNDALPGIAANARDYAENIVAQAERIAPDPDSAFRAQQLAQAEQLNAFANQLTTP